jgi:tRNA U34 5-carboxymethylaminomethyl modifying enzyme MnmG/GidA
LRREWGVPWPTRSIEQVEVSVKYAGYIDKQNDEVTLPRTTRT